MTPIDPTSDIQHLIILAQQHDPMLNALIHEPAALSNISMIQFLNQYAALSVPASKTQPQLIVFIHIEDNPKAIARARLALTLGTAGVRVRLGVGGGEF